MVGEVEAKGNRNKNQEILDRLQIKRSNKEYGFITDTSTIYCMEY